MRTTTVSSVLTTTQALTSGVAAPCAPVGVVEKPRLKTARGGGGRSNEAAAGNRKSCAHDRDPPFLAAQTPAACLMPARTRLYVPQRQMLVMLASMSASVGFGVFASSAAAAMIMPDWQ